MPGIPGRGERIGSAYVKVYFSGDNSGIKDSLNDADLEKEAEDAGERQGDAYNEGWVKKLGERFEADEKFRKRSEAAAKGWITRRAKDEEALIRVQSESNETAEKFINLMRGRPFATTMDRIRDRTRLIGQNIRDWRPSLTGFLRFLGRVGDTLGRVGNTVGRMFGKGSRNDFLNIVGRVVGAIPTAIGAALSALGKLGGSVAENVTVPLEEASNASKGLSSTLAAGIPGLIAAGAVFVALGASLGVASSAVMLLTGAVIALAGSLSFALVGGITAAAGALVPLGAALGIAVLAIKNMNKEQKAAFSGIGEAFNKLGKVAAGELFKNAGADAKQFRGIIDSLLPIVAGIAHAMRDVAEGMLDALSGPGAQKFINFLGRVLPGMIRQIGDIAINVGGFLADMFVAATPLIEDFLGWLSGITESLAHVGEGGGGSKLAGFFDQARRSMHAVGDALGQIIGLVGDLFTAGAPAGDDIFESLATNVRKFRRFLQQAKEDGSLAKFFQDAKRLAGEIGKVVVKVGRFVDALDTPTNRRILIFMVRYFGLIIDELTAIVTWNNKVWGTINRVAHLVAGFFANAWDKVKTAAGATKDFIERKFGELVGWFRDLPGKIRDALSPQSLGDTLGTAIFNGITNALGGLPGAIVKMFTGLGGRIANEIGNIVPHIDWPDPPGWLKKITPLATGGLIMGPTRALIGERGPEAVVPLSGPLSRVDPAVRELSAIARGMTTPSMASGGIAGGRSIDVGGITIITPTEDPRAVAAQVVNRLVAASYI